MYDSYGDGICCGNKNPGYALVVDGNTVAQGGADDCVSDPISFYFGSCGGNGGGRGEAATPLVLSSNNLTRRLWFWDRVVVDQWWKSGVDLVSRWALTATNPNSKHHAWTPMIAPHSESLIPGVMESFNPALVSLWHLEATSCTKVVISDLGRSSVSATVDSLARPFT
jgi:hypothetical protein